MKNMESIPDLIGQLTWKNLNGKASTQEKRLLKAFTAYYKWKNIDDYIEKLKAEGAKKFPPDNYYQQYYKIPELPKPEQAMDAATLGMGITLPAGQPHPSSKPKSKPSDLPKCNGIKVTKGPTVTKAYNVDHKPTVRAFL